MPIESAVTVNITLDAPFVSSQGLGRILIPGQNATFPDRTQVFTTAQAILDASVGITSTDYEYLAALAVFSQRHRPADVLIGKMDAFVAQQDTVTIDAATNLVVYSISINGTIVMTYTGNVGPDTDSSIATSLVGTYSGPSDITAADVGATVTLTANTAGEPFTTTISATDISLVNTTPNNGYFEELGDIAAENNDWYGLVTGVDVPGPARHDGHILEAARYAEANRKLYGCQSDDADIITAASTDLFSQLEALSRRRTFGLWHPDDSEEGVESWMGETLAINPDEGTTIWAYKTLSGVTPSVSPVLTANGQTNIEGKNGNYYSLMGGLGATFQGRCANGDPIDIRITEDWLFFRLTEDLQSLFSKYSNRGSKIPYTASGIATIAGVIIERLNIGINLGHFSAFPIPVVSPPKRQDVPASDIAARIVRIPFTVQLAGAIETAVVNGTVAVDLP